MVFDSLSVTVFSFSVGATIYLLGHKSFYKVHSKHPGFVEEDFITATTLSIATMDFPNLSKRMA